MIKRLPDEAGDKTIGSEGAEQVVSENNHEPLKAAPLVITDENSPNVLSEINVQRKSSHNRLLSTNNVEDFSSDAQVNPAGHRGAISTRLK